MKEVAIVPFSTDYNNNRIFNINITELNRDNSLMSMFILKEKLKENNVDLNTIDMYDNIAELDAVLFLTLDFGLINKCIKNGLENKMVYIALEPPVVVKEHSPEGLEKLGDLFKYIMTWQDDLIDDKKFFKINFPQYFGEQRVKKIKFNNKKLLTSISGNKKSDHPDELYSERLEVIKYFENNHSNEFDFYGFGWNKSKINYKNYYGKIDRKIDIYPKYKFAMCFENMKNINGYITEKLFDCFKAQIVPIYWGASNIESYVPKNCFIDYRKINDVDELYKYISSIDKDSYQEYINNINKYLDSDKIKFFGTQYFYQSIQNMLKVIETSKDDFKINSFSILRLKKELYLRNLKRKVSLLWR